MRRHRRLSRRLRMVVFCLIVAVVLSGIMYSAALDAEPVLTLSIPLLSHRRLDLSLAYRSLTTTPDDMHDRTVTGRTFHELRFRAGYADTVTDDYRQLTDLTVPLWPLVTTD